MKREDAEEFTKSLGQVIEGSWRLAAQGIRLGVPGLLGYRGRDAPRQWIRERISTHARIAKHEQDAAIVELAQENMKQREIAASLGIAQSTVSESLDRNRSARPKKANDSNGRNTSPDRNRSNEARTSKKTAKGVMGDTPTSADPVQTPCRDCATPQENWQHSLSSLAGDVISVRAYWSRQFPGWETFGAPSELVTLAKQAAKAWSELASAIEQQQDNCNGRSTEEAQA